MPQNSQTNPQTLEAALQEIGQLRAQLESTNCEPIAIVGMGCRLPGGINTPDDFWELLSNGREALGPLPTDRWDLDAFYSPEQDAPGKIYVSKGYYLDQVDQFDPQFFRISPREALSLDPQQRLLLEVAWEALEHADIAPDSLKGSNTGIFVGQFWDDYSSQRVFGTKPTEIDRYAQLSALRGLAAGRIAHLLDVHGPTMQVDTACSSAALAIHLACQALRNREADLALAGGVSLVLSPVHLIGICQMKALAPDGRCKTFDATADGFGQGEGCGVVTLKRLSDATQDGDRILAVIRGSAINHDGHSRTVTTPNGPAQRAMLQQALDNAGVDPHEVGYVEAHGTGTSLGDPIEVMALARILCQEREAPLYIGSVKTNIGHLDAAAGVAGLMKVVLSLQHGAIPPSLHFNEPNPRIPWADWPIRVPTELVPMESMQPLAGVSAFGMSGTNVHLLLEGFREEDKLTQRSTTQSRSANEGFNHRRHREREEKKEQFSTFSRIAQVAPDGGTENSHQERLLRVLPISARDEKALGDLVQAYMGHLATEKARGLKQTFADICFTAATGRNHFAQRLAVVASSAEDARLELAQFIEGGSSNWAFTDQSKIKRPKMAFLFTGQGAQYAGMGGQLYETEPTFRHWLGRCADILTSYLERPLLAVMWPSDDGAHNLINQTAYTQPALFAIEYALAQLWLSWGVEPDVFMGHSVGEYVAACMAGVFSLEDGLKLIAARGRLMQSLPVGGGMVSVMADEKTVSAVIQPYAETVSIAAVNGPASIVISGQDSAIQSVLAELEAQRIKAKQLTVSHAFHSPLMEPILAEFAQVAEEISFAAPTFPIISNVTGRRVTDETPGLLTTPEYWVQHLRQAVRFADGMNALAEMKINTFVEIGPKPTLLGVGRACLPDVVDSWLPSMRPSAEQSTLLASVAQLYARGVDIDWAGFEGKCVTLRRKVTLPTYPWQRQRYWIDVVAPGPATSVLHPLLHRRIPSPVQQIIFESELRVDQPPYLADHQAYGNVLLPASAYVEMVLAAGQQLLETVQLEVVDLSIQKALMLTEEGAQVQLILTPEEGGYRFGLFSRASSEANAVTVNEEWTSHATGQVTSYSDYSDVQPAAADLATLKSHYADEVSISAFEERFIERGMHYGPAFQALDQLYQATDEPHTALAHVRLTTAAHVPGDDDHYQLHPVLLDACFRVSEALFSSTKFPSKDDEGVLYLPIGVRTLTCFAPADASSMPSPVHALWVHATGSTVGSSRIVDLNLMNGDGASVATIEGLTLRAAPLAARQRQAKAKESTDISTEWLYQIGWQEKALAEENDASLAAAKTGPKTASTWLIVADDQGYAQQLRELLLAQNQVVLLAANGAAYGQIEDNHIQLNLTSASEYERLITQAVTKPLAGVIYLAGLSAHEGDSLSGPAGALYLTQALVRAQKSAPLWLVSSGSQAVGTSTPDGHAVWQSSLWGLGRVIQAEHPEIACICVDLEAADANLSPLLQEVQAQDGETQVAFRQGKRYVARLVAADLEPGSPVALHADAAYLITGGLGALGLEMARSLAEAGARHLILSGRRGVTTAEQRRAIEALEADGIDVQIAKADVAKAEDVAHLLQQAQRPLCGVIHAAGVLDDGMVMQQTAERFATVAAPKVLGAWNLHTQTAHLDLDFFVLFSSVASLIGSIGQANYAAANAFMDGLAHHRRQNGLPALAVNWGPWGAMGMATAAHVRRRLANEGWETISSAQGWQALQILLQNDVAQAGVLPIDWTTFLQKVPSAGQSPFLSDIAAAVKTRAVQSGGQEHVMVARIKAASAAERHSALVAYLQTRAAQTLHIPTSQLDEQQSLINLGIDSLTSVELRNWVHNDLDVDLPLDRFLTTPTIGALAAEIDKQLSRPMTLAADAKAEGAAAPTSSRWVLIPQPKPQATMRLFCFPYAGGGASAYRQWANELPDEIELCLIQYPGREERLQEEPFTDLTALVDALLPSLLPTLDRPFAFFGHSMGAMVAFEVTRRLQAQNAPMPRHLFLSSRQAPQLVTDATPLRFLPDDAFLDQLHNLYDAVPEVIRENRELQALFLPILRADVALLETHTYLPGNRLACPISVFGGEDDRSVSHEALAAWREQAASGFNLKMFAGGHFYLDGVRGELVKAVIGQLVH